MNDKSDNKDASDKLKEIREAMEELRKSDIRDNQTGIIQPSFHNPVPDTQDQPKQCPFCGKIVQSYKMNIPDSIAKGIPFNGEAVCRNPDCYIENIILPLDFWNHRPAEDTKDEKIKELEKFLIDIEPFLTRFTWEEMSEAQERFLKRLNALTQARRTE